MDTSTTSLEQTLQAYFARQGDVRLVYLFGSQARGGVRPDSDVDLAVQLDAPLMAGRKMQLIDDLADVTGRPIDLIDLATAGEPLLGQILAGRRLYGDDLSHAAIINRHVFDAADFLPYRNRILEERRRAWIGK